jgi:DNA-directed RNA polymerase subunit H (RpoH/RPB5)
MELSNMDINQPTKQYMSASIMNDSLIKEQILLNLLKMLIARNIINNDNLNRYVKSAFESIDQNDETSITLSDVEKEKIGSDKIIVKFISRKLTTIRKVVDIEDFLDKPFYKFVIVSNIALKVEKQFMEYKNTELFYGNELQINLIDHILIPKHFLLNQEEVKQLEEAYNFDIKNAKRMFINDPVSRYYNAKIGDIFRIERPSLATGIVCDYRVVYQGSIYK